MRRRHPPGYHEWMMDSDTSGKRLGEPGLSRIANFTWAILAVVVLSGCLDSVQVEPAILWEGVLVPPDGSPVLVEGTAAMVANLADTQVGIGVRSVVAEDGALEPTLNWWLRSGRCDGPGAPIAEPDLFPPLTLDEGQGGSAEFVLQSRLSGRGTYAVELWSQIPGRSEVLACADMVRID